MPNVAADRRDRHHAQGDDGDRKNGQLDLGESVNITVLLSRRRTGWNLKLSAVRQVGQFANQEVWRLRIQSMRHVRVEAVGRTSHQSGAG